MKRAAELLHNFPGERRFWELMSEHCASQPHSGSGKPVGLWAWDFEVWDDLLDAAQQAGLAAIELRDPSQPADEKNLVGFGGLFGPALLRRWRWLRDARARGLTPRDAELEIQQQFANERAAESQRIEQEARDAARRRQQAADSRGRRRGVEAEI